MRIELLIAMLVVSITATAQQTATDSAANSKPGIDSLLKGVLERNGGSITSELLTCRKLICVIFIDEP